MRVPDRLERRDPGVTGGGGWEQAAAARAGRLLLGASIALVTLWSALSWRITIDDSYIFYRYARNIAAGLGPVFNPGERVEGFTSPAWTAVLALGAWCGLDPEGLSKVLGLAGAIAILFLVHEALVRAGTAPPIAGCAALWLACSPSVNAYVTTGMETIPFAAAVTATTLVPGMLGPRRRAWSLAAGLLVTATMRPEGIVIALAIGGFWWFHDRSTRIAVGAALAATAGLVLLRVAYYGSPVSNTYLVKPLPIHALLDGRWEEGLRAFVRAFRRNMIPLYDEFGGPALVMLALLGAHRRLAAYGINAAAGVAVIGSGLLVLMPSDWMPGQRFAVPLAPVMVYLGARGAQRLWTTAPRDHRSALAFAIAVALAIGLARNTMTTAEWTFLNRSGSSYAPLRARQVYLPIGEWLRAHASPGDRVLAYEIGAIGYGSGLAIIDHEGLVTPPVARIIRRAGEYGPVRTGRDPVAMRAVVDYCVAQAPEWFVVRTHSREPVVPGRPVDPVIADEPVQGAILEAMGPAMVAARTFALNRTGDDRYVLVRRDRRP